MSVRVRLLGRPQMTVGGRVFEPPADRRSALLYYLAYAGGWVQREDLLYLFWPDSEERRARASLRQLLKMTRETAFGSGLEAERTRVRWCPETDLTEWFAGNGESGSRLVWPGHLLEGFHLAGAPEFDTWLEFEQSAWSSRFRSSLLAAAQAAEQAAADRRTTAPAAAGDSREHSVDDVTISAALGEWLALEPLDEEVLRLWLELCERLGRRPTAIERFERFERDLMAEMGTAPHAATLALVERLRSAGAAFRKVEVADDTLGVAAATRSHGAVLGGAPALREGQRTDRFVGRLRELERIAEELSVVGGTVTIVAPGGMGKTRLALEVAARLGPRFPDGAVVVPLTEATDVAGVAPLVAQSLGIRRGGGQDLDADVVEALVTSRLLLVLDNLEQLTGIGALIGRWRARAPGVAWLLTSRVQLDPAFGSLIELTGLPYPEVDEEVTDASPAVGLLLDRARGNGVSLDPVRDAVAIGRLTRLTGGMPLAIELAAGWLRVLPLAKIADEIEAGLGLSAVPDGAFEPRHVSVRAVLESAWDALGETERGALARLAAFRGGFDERAAREVAEVGRPLLLSLRNRSMLSLATDGRFGWHPLLETYLRERAELDPEVWNAARTAHARYFVDLLLECEELYRHGDSARAIATLKAEHPNLEAAWTRAVELGWWDDLQGWGGVLGLSYESVGQPDRWYSMIETALEHVPRGTVGWASLEMSSAVRAGFAGRREEYYLRCKAVIAVLSEMADAEPFAWGFTHLLFGQAAWALGKAEEARAAVAVTIDGFTRAGSEEMLCEAYANLLAFSESPEDFERWSGKLEAWSEEQGRQGKDDAILGVHSKFLATVYGEYGKAIETLRRELEQEREHGWHLSGIASLLAQLAKVHAQAGHLQTATSLLDEYLSLHRDGWMLLRDTHPDTLALRAQLCLLRGEPDFAVYLRPGSTSERTPRGLLLRAEVLRGRLEFETARSCAHEAFARSKAELVGVERSDWMLRSLVAQAEVSAAVGERAAAIDVLVRAIDLALDKHLLPALLLALATAKGLLPSAFAATVVALVVDHPATPYEARRRLTPTLTSAEPATDREDAWRRAADVATAAGDLLAAELTTD